MKTTRRDINQCISYNSFFESIPSGFLELHAQQLLRTLKQHGPEALNLSAQMLSQPQQLMPLIEFGRVNKIARDFISEQLGVEQARTLADLTAIVSASLLQRCISELISGAECCEDEITLHTDRLICIKFKVFSSKRLAKVGIYFLSFQDVSAQKMAELELMKNEYKFRTLFEAANISFQQLDVSRQGRIFRALKAQGVTDLTTYIDEHPDFINQMMEAVHIADLNPYSMQLYGATDKAQVLGPVTKFWIPGNCDAFRKSIEAGYRGETGYQGETQIVRLNGEVIDILFASASTPVLRDIGMVILTIVDISPWVKAREQRDLMRQQLAHMSRITTLGELSASIAHEVNQPLAAICSYGEAAIRRLKNEPAEVDRALILVRNMINDAHRAANIITRIRGMAKREEVQLESLSLVRVVEEALMLLSHELSVHQIRLDLKVAKNMPHISANQVQMTQVVVNIVLNAVQALAEVPVTQRQIWLNCKAEPGQVCLEIADAGGGISQQDLPHVFDSFYTTKSDGIGLGLQICRTIIESHGGNISVSNQSTGAIFRILLPI